MSEQRRAFWQLQLGPEKATVQEPSPLDLVLLEIKALRAEVQEVRDALLPGQGRIITGIEVTRTMRRLR